MDSDKHKHLDFIHNTINRMSTNSFLIKGWAITTISALFLFADGNLNNRLLILAIISTIIFWFLNAFFLQQERKFRELYNKVRFYDETEIDFSMSTREFKNGQFSLASCLLGKTIWPIYAAVIVMSVLVKYLSFSTGASNL